MPYSVLILDDDADFNSLLTDIFEQADYIVTSLTDPMEAVEAFRETDYDLVVTDHKMPEMSGAEFMATIKRIKPEVPIIMVSGYLENDTIRELISEGVGGVFLKPLNIFSLLERTNELIEEARKIENSAHGREGRSESDLDSDVKLGFNFHSYPCKTGVSTSFAERLYNLRNFKSTLSLIGERGIHYRAICKDIEGFYDKSTDSFVYLTADSFNYDDVITRIAEAKKQGAERVTCALLELEKMSDEQKKMASSLPKRDGLFKDVDIPLRTIFCVSGDLDSLFDEGLIDENLYILMGTAEVRVPPLRECKVDVGVMAQQLVAEFAHEKNLGTVPRFEKSARDFLRQQKWEGNYEELRATIRKVIESSSGGILSMRLVKSSLQAAQKASPRARLESHLVSYQTDLIRAVSILLGGEGSDAARFFAVNDVNAVTSRFQ